MAFTPFIEPPIDVIFSFLGVFAKYPFIFIPFELYLLGEGQDGQQILDLIHYFWNC